MPRSEVKSAEMALACGVGTKHGQRSKPSAQQELSLARRRLFYARTITRFESQFQYPLWESEKEYLAQLLHLKVERPVRNEDAIRDASSFPQRAQGSAKVAQHDPRSERGVRDNLKSDNLKSDAARKMEGDTTGHRREAAEEIDDSEVDDIEDRETEKALQWLGAE